TGKLPFDGTTGPQLMMQHVMGAPNLSALPAADQPVVARALAKKPEERFDSCLDFVQALCQAGGSAAELDTVANLVSRSAESETETQKPAATPLKPAEAPALPEEQPAYATNGRDPAGEEPGEHPSGLVEYVPQPPPPERAETTGDGILFPALVVSLGGLGREVLKEFRKSLRKRGPTETWPHIRLLNIDTNPNWRERAIHEPDSVLT